MRKMRGDRERFGRLGGADDGGVAGAAAKVARKRCVVIGIAVEMRGGHRDGKPRCAKTALAAVMVDERLLYRMQGAIRGGEALDGGDMFARQLGQEQDAGIQRVVAAGIRDHDRASAAVAFVAAFFCAGELAFLAQPVEQGCGWGRVAQADSCAVEVERNIHSGRAPPRYHMSGRALFDAA